MADETQEQEFDNTNFQQTLIDTSKDDAPVEEEAKPEEEVEEFVEEEPEAKPPKKVAKPPEARTEEPGEEGEEEKEKKPEPKPDEQKFKVKVLGQEREVMLKDLVRGYQKSESADRRFQEAAQKRQEADGILSQFKENPWKAFEYAGMDAYQAAERVVWDRYIESRMTPAQRAAWKAQQRLEDLEAREAAREQEQLQARAQEEAQRQVEAYHPLLNEAVKQYGVPDTDYAANKLVEYLFRDLNDGIEPDASSLAQRVNDDLAKELASLRSLPPERLDELLGEETAKKLAKARVDKGKVRPGGSKVVKQPAKQPVSKNAWVTEDEFEEAMEKFRQRG